MRPRPVIPPEDQPRLWWRQGGAAWVEVPRAVLEEDRHGRFHGRVTLQEEPTVEVPVLAGESILWEEPDAYGARSGTFRRFDILEGGGVITTILDAFPVEEVAFLDRFPDWRPGAEVQP